MWLDAKSRPESEDVLEALLKLKNPLFFDECFGRDFSLGDFSGLLEEVKPKIWPKDGLGVRADPPACRVECSDRRWGDLYEWLLRGDFVCFDAARSAEVILGPRLSAELALVTPLLVRRLPWPVS